MQYTCELHPSEIAPVCVKVEAVLNEQAPDDVYLCLPVFPASPCEINIISLHYRYASIHGELNLWLRCVTAYYAAISHLPWQLLCATQVQSTHITSPQASPKCD